MSVPATPLRPNRRVRVVLSTTTLLSFMSVSKATALALAELGVAVFFVAGVARSFIGESALWFILAASVLSAVVRAIDIEGWAFFIPGGLPGRAQRAFGSPVANIATAAVLTERLLLVAMASVLCGQYAVSFGAAWIAEWSVTARLTVQELVVVGATLLIGVLWVRYRLGVSLSSAAVARAVWLGVGVIGALIVFGLAALMRQDSSRLAITLGLAQGSPGNASLPAQLLRLLAGFAFVLPVLGGGDALARAAHEFAPPRLQALRRTSIFVVVFVFITTGLSSLLFVALVPARQANFWANTPLSGLAQHLNLPEWAIGLMVVLIPAATLAMLLPAAHAALEDAEQLLRRLWTQQVLDEHLGRPSAVSRGAANSSNVAAAAAVLITFVSGAQIAWLSRAYGIAIATTLLLKIATLQRLRKIHREPRAFSLPMNLRFSDRELPLGLIVVGAVVGLSALALLLRGDIPSLAAMSLIGGLAFVIAAGRRESEARVMEEAEPFELSTSPDISLGQVEVRPDNVLVCVRHPHSLGHVTAALQECGDRDVVVVTARLLGIDVDDETGGETASTREERRLFSHVVAVTERCGRPVRLLIVPAHNVFDGIIAVAVRLHSSEVHVGESSSLSADDQGRLLSEAWERAEKPKSQHLRLVIHGTAGHSRQRRFRHPDCGITECELECKSWRPQCRPGRRARRDAPALPCGPRH